MRLHHHRVAKRGTLRLLRRWGAAEAGARSRPGVTIEIIQHGTAPIAFRGGRCGTGKTHAECDFIRQRQMVDVPGTHRVAQSRGGGLRVIGDLPQRRCEAREQQPENQRHGQRLCEDAAAIAQAATPAGRRAAAGHAQQGRGGEPTDADQIGQEPEGVAFQQRREAHEINDQGDDVDIALSLRLQQFQTRGHAEKRRAGNQAVEGMETQKQQRHDQRGDRNEDAARGCAAAAARQPQANEAAGDGHDGHPDRQRRDMRQQRQREAA